MKSIDEERRDAERRLGRDVIIYSAFPYIGRFLSCLCGSERRRTYSGGASCISKLPMRQ